MKIPKGLVIALVIVVIVLLIGVGVWVGVAMIAGRSSPSSALSPYSAVYLSTGDIYFGKLDWLPTPHMEDAWFLQRSTDAKGNATIGVYPFGQVAWGPSNEVYFNSNQIIFWTRLNATSSVAQLIADPAAVTAQQQSAAAAQVPANPTAPSASSSPYGHGGSFDRRNGFSVRVQNVCIQWSVTKPSKRFRCDRQRCIEQRECRYPDNDLRHEAACRRRIER